MIDNKINVLRGLKMLGLVNLYTAGSLSRHVTTIHVSGKVYSFPNIGPAKRVTEDVGLRRPLGSAMWKGA